MSSLNPPRLSLKAFWVLLRPHPLRPIVVRILLACGLLLLESSVSVATPWVFSHMVQQLSGGALVTKAIVALLVQYAFLRFIESVAGPLRDIIVVPLRAFLKRRVVLLGLEHIYRLSARFHADRQTGALTRILDRGADAAGSLLDLSLSNVLPNVIGLLLTFGVIIHVFNWQYVFLLLGTVILYAIISYIFTKLRMAARRQRNQANNAAHHHLVDGITNLETVRAFGNERYEVTQHDTVRARLQKADIRLQYLVSSSQIVRNIIIAFATILLLGLAIIDIVHHRIGVAQFVLIGTYIRNVYAAVGALNYVGAGWRNARVDMENYLELLALTPEIASPPQPHFLSVGHKEAGGVAVEFSHVSFGYDPSRLILKDITCCIPAGKTLAVVGQTGSGKSTLARLISRLYDPIQGEISFDGYDIRSLSLDNLRQQLGIVPQECILFNASIGDNIAYGRVGASFEEVREAAHRAQIGDFIESLPNGYDTLVGERGLKLSGGEKQRVAIARVILRDPRLLILDEATSALDTQTEARIQRELSSLSHGRTTFIIAHRLSTVQDADHIMVLGDGCIVEEGTHATLLALEGKYASMWSAQAGRGSL
ncbi:ATP-binding cassette domain-containing protein [Saccharibacter sp. 17.LH.SD]|uniref:ABCB family ABC transporter ATP-binding protein/permease n=1 Tax=Saccharibacter sp. 17.LH.SD TaxID=2689393 RepID=UPI00136C0875|nr:ATP-binding cassette domain-containing protein [Saccharibacter sp. 17.LH.SD]MXV44621.1 ATP-binding cassette domain-containing protein [Saccharibacter sp. 17.LH.SD]